MEPVSPARRIQRIRHELHRRELTVSRVEPLGKHFVSVTFTGESLATFASDSFDDHVKLFLEPAAGEPVRRDYTPRRFDRDARELTVEFALHGHGAASEWARHLAPGEPAVIGGPRGSMVIPMDYDWHLLVGDSTALPAIHRRIEELPASTRVIAVLQADRRDLASAAELAVHWVPDDAALLATLRTLPLPSGDGFAWCAGEARAMAQVRALLLEEKRLPKESMKVAAYWKQGASDFHETLGD